MCRTIRWLFDPCMSIGESHIQLKMGVSIMNQQQVGLWAKAAAGLLMAVAAFGACAQQVIVYTYQGQAFSTQYDASGRIERLRFEYNEDIPAILITGDTAPQRLLEAKASGHMLLHKPVPPKVLREQIVAAIAGAAADAAIPD